MDLAQVRRQQPAVAQQSAVLALQGHAARACETQLGLGGQAHGTARRRQRVPVMGWPSPRGRAASRGLWGEEENQRNRDTTRSLSGPRASQPLWQPCDGGRSMREDALHDKEPHMESIIVMDRHANIRWINEIAIHRNDGR